RWCDYWRRTFFAVAAARRGFETFFAAAAGRFAGLATWRFAGALAATVVRVRCFEALCFDRALAAATRTGAAPGMCRRCPVRSARAREMPLARCRACTETP